MTRAEAILDLQSVCQSLGGAELGVLRLLARRLLHGQVKYGQLEHVLDKKDWRLERSEELEDLLVYTAIYELAEELERKK